MKNKFKVGDKVFLSTEETNIEAVVERLDIEDQYFPYEVSYVYNKNGHRTFMWVTAEELKFTSRFLIGKKLGL